MTIFLVHATPYDPATSGETDVRLSIGAKTPKYDGFHWPARLLEKPEIESTFFNSAPFERSSEADLAGKIVIGMGDGDVDDLRDYYWDGRSIMIYRGDESDAFSSFTIVLSGTVRAISWTRTEMEIEIDAAINLLDVPLQGDRYAGTGGMEGDSNLSGKSKPRVFGYARHVQPTLLNGRMHYYQVSPNEIEEFSDVYNRGVRLSPFQATTDVTNHIVERYRTPFQNASFVSPDGAYVYATDVNTAGDAAVYQYQIFQNDLETASLFAGRLFELPADCESGDPVTFSADGLHMYVFARNAGKVYEFALTSAYQISSASYTSGDFFDLAGAGIATSASIHHAFAFRPNGERLYVLGEDGASDEGIFQLDLSTAWDITTASWASGDYLQLETDRSPTQTGLAFVFEPTAGDTVVVYRQVDDDVPVVYAIDLSVAWDVTSSSTKSAEVDLLATVNGAYSSYSSTMFAFPNGDLGLVGLQGSTAVFVTDNAGAAVTDNSGAEVKLNASALAGLIDVSVIRLPTVWDLTNARIMVPADSYAFNLSNGSFIAAVKEAGIVTADVMGEVFGGSAGALMQSGEIAAELVQEAVTDADLIDLTAFTDLDSAAPYDIGYYLTDSERPSVRDVVREILSSVGAVLIGGGTAGKIAPKRIEIGTASVTLAEADVAGFRQVPAARPVFSMELAYAPAWRPLTDDELDEERASTDTANFVRRATRLVQTESVAVETEHKRARSAFYVTYLSVEANATTELTRRFNLLSEARYQYRVRAPGFAYSVSIGDTITLDHPDMATAPLDLIVQEIKERPDGSTDLTLWG